MDFTDKVVLITGASSGIGAATAEVFAKRGAKVAIVGRNVENLEATKSACLLANAACECLLIAADVTVDTERVVAVTLSNFNRIDILINNAGILASGGILEADVEQYDNILNTNLRAVFLLTKLCVPHLIKSQGTIINVSSVAGLRSFSGALNYCVSKAALDQFTKCVALDLAPLNVRVNAVNPGVVITDIHKRAGMSEDEYEKYLERSKGTHAMGRVGNVFEVAETILFLASSGASFITGACVPIDGGKHAMCPR